MHDKYASHYRLYTDGSMDEICLGAAFYDPQTNVSSKFKINAKISIMNCELIAIAEALSYIRSLDEGNYVIFTDSKSSIQHLAQIPSSCRGIPIAMIILDSICRLHGDNKNVIIQWIPSHIGIAGNEEADSAARQAAQDGPPYSCLPLPSDLLGDIKLNCIQIWREYFDERSLSKGIWYKTMQSEPLRYPWFDDMERKYVVALLRLRSGHIPSNKFMHLMGMTESPNCSVCGVMDDILHVLTECERNAAQRRHAYDKHWEVGLCNSILASPLSRQAKMLSTLLIVLY